MATDKTFRVGIVGARGHTGRELLRLVAAHPRVELAFAASREFEGRPVAEIAPECAKSGLRFEALSPEAAAARAADAVFLALPDGAGAPFVAAFDAGAPDTALIDLSADHRFDDAWIYGLPERRRDRLRGARRIANPGCYATALQLAVAPCLPYLAEAPSVFGVSGYSGAGSTPNPRNDVERLADNLMPYALTGHKHEREASRHLGRPVRFTPHVAPAFRGIVVTAHLAFKTPLAQAAFRDLYDAAYGGEPLVRLQDAAPELKDGANAPGAILGGFALGDLDASGCGARGVVVAAEDNLLKGAAVQAMQNLNLALQLPEYAGILDGFPGPA